MSNAYILDGLLDVLWSRYKKRVAYAAKYQTMVEERGGTVQNDHIAFRTFNANVGEQPAGVEGIARIFTALGYQRKDTYVFADKKLTAWHYEHATNSKNPKIFISQLEIDQLTPVTADIIKKTIAVTPDLITSANKRLLDTVADNKPIDLEKRQDLIVNLAEFFSRPWLPPQRDMVVKIDKESQYAAWTLLHGNSVNHFTAFINAQNVSEWPDIEVTVEALRKAGLPMKDEMEGERGTKLRQSSTKAADAECDVIEADGSKGKMIWSYAYYELAERNMIAGPDGRPMQFQGFLGAQATNLFEMTKRN